MRWLCPWYCSRVAGDPWAAKCGIVCPAGIITIPVPLPACAANPRVGWSRHCNVSREESGGEDLED
eukprot:7757385-Prorocentrum_lima.AAC.1